MALMKEGLWKIVTGVAPTGIVLLNNQNFLQGKIELWLISFVLSVDTVEYVISYNQLRVSIYSLLYYELLL